MILFPSSGLRVLGVLGLLLAGSNRLLAKPSAPSIFCSEYPAAPNCQNSEPACTFCHTTPPARNAYGMDVESMLLPGAARPLTDPEYDSALPAALRAVGSMDADGDGSSNEEEILLGTLPSDDTSFPIDSPCPTNTEKNGFDVCGWDPNYTYKKVALDFCGRSATQNELENFQNTEDKTAAVETLLSSCLDTEYWHGQDGVLWRMAHKKIRPNQTLKSGEGQGNIPLADYFDDYNLFTYASTGNRDVRDLLTARYIVDRSVETGRTVYEAVERGVTFDLLARGAGVAQLVPTERRAGMLTTRWFLMINTMFTAIPRTTAAQAYRAYLGLDISKLEGLSPVANEPIDYDTKNVDAQECAICHSTLDPLTYPFTRYEGITLNGSTPFTYSANRLQDYTDSDGPGVVNAPESGTIFGASVQDLLQWANVAANSDEFAQTIVMDYWTLLLGEAPRPDETEAFNQLWQDLKDKNTYRVERMLLDLVKTEAYGVP